MRLGINFTPPHESPQQWGESLAKRGYRAVSFPVDYKTPVNIIDAYVKAARQWDLRIAEVGVWNSPNHPDQECARKAKEHCLEQFRLADYVKADCCVNVSGAAGPVWYYCYRENYSEELYDRNVKFVQDLCDTVQPKYTAYALEPMQWMLPWSVGQYRQFLSDVGRGCCKVHMDIFNMISNPYLYTHQEELMESAVDMLGKEIVSCHIKDIRMGPEASVAIREVPVGTGEANLAYYLKQIGRLDPDIPVLIEHLGSMAEYDKALLFLKTLSWNVDA